MVNPDKFMNIQNGNNFLKGIIDRRYHLVVKYEAKEGLIVLMCLFNSSQLAILKKEYSSHATALKFIG